MANPLIPQGTLNRLRGSIVFDGGGLGAAGGAVGGLLGGAAGATIGAALGNLVGGSLPDITASYMGEEGINISLEGEAADTPDTMVGFVTSPAPYMKATVEVELNKAIALADTYKRRLESNAVVGDFTVWPDSPTLSNYVFTNGIIVNCQPGRLNGKNVGLVLTLRGLYPINSGLFT